MTLSGHPGVFRLSPFFQPWNFGRTKYHAHCRFLANREIRCRHPWEVIVLDTEGNVKPCMNWSTESPLGSCSHQTYDEIWAGAGFSQLRDELTGRAPLRHTCRHCPALFSGRVDDDSAFKEVSL